MHFDVRPNIRKMVAYSPGKPIDEVKRELGLDEVIKLASNENPLGPSPRALEAMQAALPELHRYPDASGFELRQALAAKFSISPEQILIGNGSDELIHLIGLLFLTPNSNMVVGKPSFVRYNAAAQIAGCELREVPLNARYEFDVDAMAAACDANTKLVWLANPNNPTGTITRRAELDRLLERMPANAVLVLDEAYFEYACAEPDYPDSLDFLRRGAPVIGLRTMSKAYGLAGIRVGYGFAPIEIASSINGAKEPFSLNSLAQVAAIAALSDADHVQNSLQLNEMGRRRLMEALLQLDVEPIESYANFVLVDMKQAAEPLFRAMLAQGVIVRSGHVLGLPECLRISIGTEYEVSRCIDALHAVLKKPVAP